MRRDLETDGFKMDKEFKYRCICNRYLRRDQLHRSTLGKLKLEDILKIQVISENGRRRISERRTHT